MEFIEINEKVILNLAEISTIAVACGGDKAIVLKSGVHIELSDEEYAFVKSELTESGLLLSEGDV